MWHVYQLRSDTELLYVGYSRWPKRRLGEHRRQKPWWPEVTDIRSEEFATEDEARRQEKQLWANGRPKYNQVSPFQTPEEVRKYQREYMRSPEQRERTQERLRTPQGRERQRKAGRKYARSPEGQEGNRARLRAWRAQNPEKVKEQYRRRRAYQREWSRRNRASGPVRRGEQDGPGLF